MDDKSRYLKILILARNSDVESNRFLIAQLQKITNCFRNMKIVMLTAAPVKAPKGMEIEYITEERILRNFEDGGSKGFDLLILENIGVEDIGLIVHALRSQVLVMAERGMIEGFPQFLVPGKTVIPYSRLNTFQLAMSMLEILRNFVERRSFLNEAQRIAMSWELVGEVKLKGPDQPGLQPAKKPEKGKKNPGASMDNRLSEMVDLVIINYNTLNYLRECLNSIAENTLSPHKVIVVDNGSTDGSVEYLRKIKEITLVENETNGGYARACNQGIAAGRSEYVVILNSDIKVTPGWLKPMIDTLKSNPDIGVVGPKMVNEHRLIVGAGVTKLDAFCGPRGWMAQDREGLFDAEEDCYSVGGACYLIRRKALARVGAFDENYFFYFEETDLSLRMLEKGYRVVYCPKSRIIHHHEGSLEKNNPEERAIRNGFFEESQKRFTCKWKAVLDHSPVRGAAKEIVAFGIIPWQFRYQRPQQIFTRFGKLGYRILYINNVCVTGGKLERVGENIYSFMPDGEGLVYHALKSARNTRRIINSIYEVLGRLEIINPVLWVDVPYWQSILSYFDRQYLIYNCMDSYADFSDLQEHCPHLSHWEEELGRTADLILTSSGLLKEKLTLLNPNTYVIPNGVDLEHFSPDESLETPPDIARIPQPIVGYFGAIADWIDLDLMYYLAEQLPEFSFVYIGHSTVDLRRFGKLANVYFLGEKSYFDLPKYVKHFQVGLIPFRKNRLTLSTNPVKLYEYLASGIPVVSVDLPEIRQFKEVVYIARDYVEFALYTGEIAHWEGSWFKHKRVNAVAEEDWQNRVAEVQKLINGLEQLRKTASKLPALPGASR